MTEQLEQEIRTLRSLFWSDRDPEGLAFAPLADAYRRAGQFRQAVELLSHGRVRHPDFATGHVVAARLFMEKGLLEEGELAARRVLELDEDNILALGLLADAVEAKGGTLEAQSLRARVNELAPSQPADAEERVVDIAELAPDEPTDADERVVDIGELAPDEPMDAEELVMDVAELAPSQPADADERVVDIAELAPDEPMDAEELVMDVAELAPLDAEEPVNIAEPAPDGPEAAGEPEDAAESGEAGDFEDDGMLVTRTLADLYARQGFTAEALEVYRQLLEIDPDDEELRRKVTALESRSKGETRGEPLVEEEGKWPERAALEEDEPVEHVWQTQGDAEGHDVDTPFAWIGDESEESTAAGPPISEYFQRLLAWEPGDSGAGAGRDDQAGGPLSDSSGDDLTSRMNEDGP